MTIFPRVQRESQLKLQVVGAEAPEDILNLATTFGDLVQMTGYIEDLTPAYESCRVFVAPHRFAAGIPLKVLEAMSYGVPCVISSLHAEQLEVSDQVEAVVASDAASFAEKVLQLTSDSSLWQRV